MMSQTKHAPSLRPPPLVFIVVPEEVVSRKCVIDNFKSSTTADVENAKKKKLPKCGKGDYRHHLFFPFDGVLGNG